jgi:hypothetical protein
MTGISFFFRGIVKENSQEAGAAFRLTAAPRMTRLLRLLA